MEKSGRRPGKRCQHIIILLDLKQNLQICPVRRHRETGELHQSARSGWQYHAATGGGGGGGFRGDTIQFEGKVTSEGGVKMEIPAVIPWSLMISLSAVAAPWRTCG